jgi:hypothetical protein
VRLLCHFLDFLVIHDSEISIQPSVVPPETRVEASCLPVVHVGFPKCGSTTIQHHYFAQLPDAVFISRQSNLGHERYWGVYDQISRAITRGSRVAAARNAWMGVCGEKGAGKRIIFSDERITLPGRHGRFSTILQRAERVRGIIGPAKIIVVIRHPLEGLRSLYQHMAGVNSRRGKVPASFAEWLGSDPQHAVKLPGSPLQILYFAEIALKYSETFGLQNVAVFFLEDLSRDPFAFYSSLSEALGFLPAGGFVPRGAPKENATATKASTQEFSRSVPDFAKPVFPEAFLDFASTVITQQANLLRAVFDIDSSTRWDPAGCG